MSDLEQQILEAETHLLALLKCKRRGHVWINIAASDTSDSYICDRCLSTATIPKEKIV